MSYKWCAVPGCTSTSIKTPEKLFVCVPTNVKKRKKWLQLARRNPGDIKANSVVFFCEDHFQMEKDMANYYQYKMGFSQRILMKDGVLPSKFHCQQDRRKRMCTASSSRPAFVKRQKLEIIRECENIQPTVPVQEIVISEDLVTTEPLQLWNRCTSTEPIVTAEKSVQCNFQRKVKFRSKAVQTKILTKDRSVSPFKLSTTSTSTSPFKIRPCRLVKLTKAGITDKKRRIGFVVEERSGSDISLSGASKQDSSSIENSQY